MAQAAVAGLAALMLAAGPAIAADKESLRWAARVAHPLMDTLPCPGWPMLRMARQCTTWTAEAGPQGHAWQVSMVQE